MQLTSVDQINSQYRHIYLQPHLDDAVLSAGGSIAFQTATGQKVLVVTVFGGGPATEGQLGAFASQNQQRRGLGPSAAEAVNTRRAEDDAAVSSLGADTLWLTYPDAIYRGNPPFYASDDALFGMVSPGDMQLDEVLAQLFQDIHERAPLAALYAPLGVGHHVDHQLCCSAADRLAQRKVNVKFYEDFPYVTRPGALESRQQELRIPMEPELVEVSGQIPAKINAIAQYRTEVPLLFGTEDAMENAVQSYSSSIRRTYPGIQIERFWRW